MSAGLQIKICGITSPEQAEAVTRLGADAIGMVFFPKSPRNVDSATASSIVEAVKGRVKTCGVFVNMELPEITAVIETTGIDIIQLHGEENEEYIRQLRVLNRKIIKVLKDEDFAQQVEHFSADAYLLELGKGALPGGNFQSWHWQKAEQFGLLHPYVLAGGISSDNVIKAIKQGNPQAIDVSSSVEKSPGVKDLNKVKELIDIVHAVKQTPHKERIFS